MSEMRIFDPKGNRLYMTQEEIGKFLKVAAKSNSKVNSFAQTLVYTGCRISEALELTPKSVQIDELQITFNSLKKRRGDIYRNIPVPLKYMNSLVPAHNIVHCQKTKSKAELKLWTWTRQHGYEVIMKIMIEAEISEGSHRMPKGLRHGFGINAIMKNVPLNMLQKWMGHADIATTAIYANAIGKEEKAIADKMWEE